ncbi:adenosylcobinamide-phosphate synthase CbiB [Chromobacterium haemolyticum]|uniref:Cobalamin biosynthesis protein CobD n=1 Tax=Chromobacterium rhizoryzae TaxID=1778675 RepID=A0AAD0W7S5_9NEIS|nr:adenosylcobinamide-phosphate synthase CbiB [Chromobacterium haemolyticum]AXT46660.1 cobalamin biosynthesis protein [Chromobacterium rhizoryzae]PTU69226.1 cobalamin biosynthesis protein [Chromobacterium haemolyticum]
MSSALFLPLALLLDRLLGEPRRWHPLVGFGRLTRAVERLGYPSSPAAEPKWRMRMRGALSVSLLLLPLTLAAWLLARLPLLDVIAPIALLYLAIGAKSLALHAEVVRQALDDGNLALARERVGWIVSRDTSELDEAGVARAAIESVLENGCDAVFAALFWFLLLGAPGVVLYRLSNTLDAVWGYRNARYLHFGWAAARLDDVLNYIPARLTAFTYLLLGHAANGWRCWRTQAPTWYSPNAGPVMAAGAGALGVSLGGGARYHGQWKERPPLGCGPAPAHQDIGRAVRLVSRGAWLWAGLSILWAVLIGVMHA